MRGLRWRLCCGPYPRSRVPGSSFPPCSYHRGWALLEIVGRHEVMVHIDAPTALDGVGRPVPDCACVRVPASALSDGAPATKSNSRRVKPSTGGNWESPVGVMAASPRFRNKLRMDGFVIRHLPLRHPGRPWQERSFAQRNASLPANWPDAA